MRMLIMMSDSSEDDMSAARPTASNALGRQILQLKKSLLVSQLKKIISNSQLKKSISNSQLKKSISNSQLTKAF